MPDPAAGAKDKTLRASALLRRVLDQSEGEQVAIADMVGAFGERAFGLVMILFCLPNMIPAPGIGSLFGVPLLLIGGQMAMGRPQPWLPQRIMRQSLKRSTLQGMIDAVEPRLKWLEGFLKPRWTILFSPLMDRAIGLFTVLCAASIIIPFPGTNFLPAIGLIVISLAVLQEDGVHLLIGALIALVGLFYTVTIVGGLAYAGLLALARMTGL